MKDYYKPDEHGPFDDVPVDRHLCFLQGEYVLCPSVRMGENPRCVTFNCDLEKGWKGSLRGVMGEPRPLTHIPKRCEECKEADLVIQLVPLIRETVEDGEASDQEDPEAPESATSDESN